MNPRTVSAGSLCVHLWGRGSELAHQEVGGCGDQCDRSLSTRHSAQRQRRPCGTCSLSFELGFPCPAITLKATTLEPSAGAHNPVHHGRNKHIQACLALMFGGADNLGDIALHLAVPTALQVAEPSPCAPRHTKQMLFGWDYIPRAVPAEASAET